MTAAPHPVSLRLVPPTREPLDAWLDARRAGVCADRAPGPQVAAALHLASLPAHIQRAVQATATRLGMSLTEVLAVMHNPAAASRARMNQRRTRAGALHLVTPLTPPAVPPADLGELPQTP